MDKEETKVTFCKRCGKAPAIDPESKRMVCPDCLKKLGESRKRLREKAKEE